MRRENFSLEGVGIKVDSGQFNINERMRIPTDFDYLTLMRPYQK